MSKPFGYPEIHRDRYPNNLLYDLFDNYEQHQPSKNRVHANRRPLQYALIDHFLQLDYVPIRPLLILASRILSKRDRLILQYRYFNHDTLVRSGQKLHLSDERVRQLQHRILETYYQIGLSQTIMTLIWPPMSNDASINGHLPQTLTHLMTTLIQARSDESTTAYQQRLYDSIFQPLLPKFGVHNFKQFQANFVLI